MRKLKSLFEAIIKTTSIVLKLKIKCWNHQFYLNKQNSCFRVKKTLLVTIVRRILLLTNSSKALLAAVLHQSARDGIVVRNVYKYMFVELVFVSIRIYTVYLINNASVVARLRLTLILFSHNFLFCRQ